MIIPSASSDIDHRHSSILAMASSTALRLHQNLLDEDGPGALRHPMLVRRLHENALTTEILKDFLLIENTPPSQKIDVGVAGGYTETSRALNVLALANGSEILFLQLGAIRRKKKNDDATAADSNLQVLETEIFCSDECTTYAFNMGSLALSLYFDHGIRITNGVDIQDVCDKSGRSPLGAIQFAIGDRGVVHAENVSTAFRTSVWDSQTGAHTINHLASQAWVAHHLQSLSDMEETFRVAARVNTRDKPPQVSCRTVFSHALVLAFFCRKWIVSLRWSVAIRRLPRKASRLHNTIS